MFLHYIFPCAINSEAGIVLSLFLIFGDFEPRCSYKNSLYISFLRLLKI